MNKKWPIHLSAEERSILDKLVKTGKSSARTIRRAQTLILANKKTPDKEIASVLSCSEATIYLTKKAYCEHGLQQSLNDKVRSGRPEKLVGKSKAHLIALACSETPREALLLDNPATGRSLRFVRVDRVSIR